MSYNIYIPDYIHISVHMFISALTPSIEKDTLQTAQSVSSLEKTSKPTLNYKKHPKILNGPNFWHFGSSNPTSKNTGTNHIQKCLPKCWKFGCINKRVKSKKKSRTNKCKLGRDKRYMTILLVLNFYIVQRLLFLPRSKTLFLSGG